MSRDPREVWQIRYAAKVTACATSGAFPQQKSRTPGAPASPPVPAFRVFKEPACSVSPVIGIAMRGPGIRIPASGPGIPGPGIQKRAEEIGKRGPRIPNP